MKTHNSQKYISPMKVITGKDTRWSCCNVWEAEAITAAPQVLRSLRIPKTTP